MLLWLVKEVMKKIQGINLKIYTAVVNILAAEARLATAVTSKLFDRMDSFFISQIPPTPKSVIKDSYLVSLNDLNMGELRLLKTDFPLILPQNTHIRILISSTDVLHSWSVPAFGIKVDAVPGRLNQISLFPKNQGIFYGQCSELCGINHAFMPIEVYILDSKTFYKIFFFLVR